MQSANTIELSANHVPLEASHFTSGFSQKNCHNSQETAETRAYKLIFSRAFLVHTVQTEYTWVTFFGSTVTKQCSICPNVCYLSTGRTAQTHNPTVDSINILKANIKINFNTFWAQPAVLQSAWSAFWGDPISFPFRSIVTDHIIV